MEQTPKPKRISADHQYLLDNGWFRVADIRLGCRIQAQWCHVRNGERKFTTQVAIYNEIQHRTTVEVPCAS